MSVKMKNNRAESYGRVMLYKPPPRQAAEVVFKKGRGVKFGLSCSFFQLFSLLVLYYKTYFVPLQAIRAIYQQPLTETLTEYPTKATTSVFPFWESIPILGKASFPPSLLSCTFNTN
jgi:hypothetical protein